jgi:hypothetical protein
MQVASVMKMHNLSHDDARRALMVKSAVSCLRRKGWDSTSAIEELTHDLMTPLPPPSTVATATTSFASSGRLIGAKRPIPSSVGARGGREGALDLLQGAEVHGAGGQAGGVSGPASASHGHAYSDANQNLKMDVYGRTLRSGRGFGAASGGGNGPEAGAMNGPGPEGKGDATAAAAAAGGRRAGPRARRGVSTSRAGGMG